MFRVFRLLAILFRDFYLDDERPRPISTARRKFTAQEKGPA
jgi:hypothetical protein